MSDKFERDTSVAIKDGASGGAVSGEWSLRKPVSGYLASIALRAAGHSGFKGRPVSASFDFTGTPAAGPIELSVKVLSSSAAKECVEVTMTQKRELILSARIWSVGALSGLEHDFEHAPSVAHPEYYPSIADLAKVDHFGDLLPVFHVLEERPVDWNSPRKWRRTAPQQTAWFRYPGANGHDDAYLSAARCLVPMSIMPAFAAMMPHDVWNTNTPQFAATTRLAVNFLGSKRSDWILVRGDAAVAGGGLISGTAKAWGEDGKPLATGITQLVSA